MHILFRNSVIYNTFSVNNNCHILYNRYNNILFKFHLSIYIHKNIELHKRLHSAGHNLSFNTHFEDQGTKTK